MPARRFTERKTVQKGLEFSWLGPRGWQDCELIGDEWFFLGLRLQRQGYHM